jgi:cytoskeletal protein CcmA (bactofilin family)
MTSEGPGSRLNLPAVSESFVSAEAVWEGKIITGGDVRVEGTVHGEVETNGALTVAPRAHIDGTIKARRIVLAGEIKGQVVCDERLELLTGSSIGGDVETGTLVVHEGAYIEANRFKMSKSELPDRR